MDQEKYYQRIKSLNIRHYAGEVPYYSKAPLRSVEEALLKKLPARSRILDLGCGSGRFSVGAALLGFDVTGVDITPEAIKAAQMRADNIDHITVKFLVGDMTVLPFKDGEFDFVFCPRFVINAVATMEKRQQSIIEMIRVVRPGGLIFIESFNKLYFGSGVTLPIKNVISDIFTYIRIFYCKTARKQYVGLLPGDITYKANKVDEASIGFAHLPTIFEIKRWIPKNKKYLIQSM